MSGLITIKDNNGIYKTMPYIRGTDGKEAYALAKEKGFTDVESKFNKNLAGMDNPYYPVGSVYMTTSNKSPAAIFGFGSWTQIQDVFILAAGDTYTLNATGGEVNVTLTVDELPSHRHYETRGRSNSGSKCVYTPYMNHSAYIATEYTGGDGAHNNMPPYEAIYAWKRVS